MSQPDYPDKAFIDDAQIAESPVLRGVDITGGLRIRLEYDKARRTIGAKWSAEAGTNVRAEVEHYIARMKQSVGYAEAWLNQYCREQGGRDE